MTGIDLSRAEWRKSSYSGQSGNCVEVARNLPGLVAVRDSKEPGGARLVVSSEAWQVFVGAVRVYRAAPFVAPFGRRIRQRQRPSNHDWIGLSLEPKRGISGGTSVRIA